MILVDTTVIVDTLKGVQNNKVVLFKDAIQRNLTYGISEYTYLEILQGARDDREYSRLNEYLLDMNIYLLPKAIETYEKASSVYFNLRRKGITIRSTIDVLIAITAMEYDLALLHNDRDFDSMKDKVPELNIYE